MDKAIRNILLIAAGLLLFFFVIKPKWVEYRHEREIVKKEDSIKNANKPPETKQQVVHPHVLTSKTFYFDQSRMIKVYLYAGWKDYPKGGSIRIETPNGGTLTDWPGAIRHFGFQPEGWYYIYATSPQTTAVEIYNYW